MGIFSCLQAYYSDAVNDWIYEHDTGGHDKIRKAEFLRLYTHARKRAFTLECIKQAFKTTGIFPLNARKQLLPARASSMAAAAAAAAAATTSRTPHKKQDVVAYVAKLQKQLRGLQLTAGMSDIQLTAALHNIQLTAVSGIEQLA